MKLLCIKETVFFAFSQMKKNKELKERFTNNKDHSTGPERKSLRVNICA